MTIDISSYYFINSPLEDLDRAEVDLLLESSVEKKYGRGEVLFKDNDFPKGVFILYKGRVKLYQRISSGADQLVNIHVPGEIIGYRPLLCNQRYPVTASAIEPTTVAFIPARTFTSLLEHSSQFSNLLLRYLSHEFTVWVNTISLLAHKTVKERLLVNLLILVAKYQEQRKWPVKITLPKNDIANLIGTSNETLARVLQKLKKDNLIASVGRAIEITNMYQLKKIQTEVKLFL